MDNLINQLCTSKEVAVAGYNHSVKADYCKLCYAISLFVLESRYSIGNFCEFQLVKRFKYGIDRLNKPVRSVLLSLRKPYYEAKLMLWLRLK
jgi:hypothetical protein